MKFHCHPHLIQLSISVLHRRYTGNSVSVRQTRHPVINCTCYVVFRRRILPLRGDSDSILLNKEVRQLDGPAHVQRVRRQIIWDIRGVSRLEALAHP